VLLRTLIAVEHIMAPELPTSGLYGEGDFSGVWGKLSRGILVLKANIGGWDRKRFYLKSLVI